MELCTFGEGGVVVLGLSSTCVPMCVCRKKIIANNRERERALLPTYVRVVVRSEQKQQIHRTMPKIRAVQFFLIFGNLENKRRSSTTTCTCTDSQTPKRRNCRQPFVCFALNQFCFCCCHYFSVILEKSTGCTSVNLYIL